MSEMRDRDPRDVREPRDVSEPRDMRNEKVTEPIREEPVRKEPMRTNPQAMPAKRTNDMDMWPDMADYRHRFDEIQSEFIQDPKSAVKNAERLMQEVVERITKSMQERMHSMHRDVDGKDGDTEALRMTMVQYRAMIDSMGGRRAA